MMWSAAAAAVGGRAPTIGDLGGGLVLGHHVGLRASRSSSSSTVRKAADSNRPGLAAAASRPLPPPAGTGGTGGRLPAGIASGPSPPGLPSQCQGARCSCSGTAPPSPGPRSRFPAPPPGHAHGRNRTRTWRPAEYVKRAGGARPPACCLPPGSCCAAGPPRPAPCVRRPRRPGAVQPIAAHRASPPESSCRCHSACNS